MKFTREFTSEVSANAFASQVGAKVVCSYDWDEFASKLVVIYKVQWTVA